MQPNCNAVGLHMCYSGLHMKSTPNDSTSPAKKSKTLRSIGGWAATELRFGLVQVLTYVRTCLAPIFKILIFSRPSRLIFWRDLKITLQEFQAGSGIPPFTMGKVWFTTKKIVISNPLRFCSVKGMCMMYSQHHSQVRSCPTRLFFQIRKLKIMFIRILIRNSYKNFSHIIFL